MDTKYNALPENLKKQVMDYIDFLFEKKHKKKSGKPKTPKFGSCKGMFEMAPDFDEPLEDFKDRPYDPYGDGGFRIFPRVCKKVKKYI